MKKIIMWVLSIFMALVAIVYFPSFSSVFAILFAVIALPVKSLQDFLAEKGLIKWVKIAILVILFFASMLTAPTKTNDEAESPEVETPSASQAVVSSQKQDKPNENNDMAKGNGSDQPSNSPILSVIDTENYVKMDADVLFEYGKYMGGEDVVTVIKIEESTSGFLKAKTDNNDGPLNSIECVFRVSDYPTQFKAGEIVTVAGKVRENLISIVDTVTIEECRVIGYGEIADELKASAEEQREVGEEYKRAYEKDHGIETEEDMYTYMSECVTAPYSEIERNPDSYKGEKIKISGSVVQVSEGWFDSVTMRIDCNGDMWYVTYTRKEGESRILEGDYITCYGECDGVTSYITVLGAQVTIPSMKMKYYT